MKPVLKALGGLFSSKKFMAAVISGVVWVGGKVGLDLDTETLIPAVAPLWGYIAAQAGADWGKEAKKIEKDGAAE